MRRIVPEPQRLPLQVGQGAPQPLHRAEAEASQPPLTRDDLPAEDDHRPGGDGSRPQSEGPAEAVPVEQRGEHQGLGQVDGQGQAADPGQGREDGPPAGSLRGEDEGRRIAEGESRDPEGEEEIAGELYTQARLLRPEQGVPAVAAKTRSAVIAASPKVSPQARTRAMGAT